MLVFAASFYLALCIHFVPMPINTLYPRATHTFDPRGYSVRRIYTTNASVSLSYFMFIYVHIIWSTVLHNKYTHTYKAIHIYKVERELTRLARNIASRGQKGRQLCLNKSSFKSFELRLFSKKSRNCSYTLVSALTYIYIRTIRMYIYMWWWPY